MLSNQFVNILVGLSHLQKAGTYIAAAEHEETTKTLCASIFEVNMKAIEFLESLIEKEEIVDPRMIESIQEIGTSFRESYERLEQEGLT